MTVEEIEKTASTISNKMSEVVCLLNDIQVCKSDKSKALILAAATKMIEPYKNIVA